jgi:hypothetical protein
MTVSTLEYGRMFERTDIAMLEKVSFRDPLDGL